MSDRITPSLENDAKVIARGAGANGLVQDSQQSYNSILIYDVTPKESGSEFIRYNYGCPECNYRTYVYHDAFEHLVQNHFKIYVEEEYLDHQDYVEALQVLDREAYWCKLGDIFSLLALARDTFIKYKSRNQRYFKKQLPHRAIVIHGRPPAWWNSFIGQLR